MQHLAVPAGDHNPHARSLQEIRDALRGTDGTRQVAFRYELLTAANVKQRDLPDVILDGQIDQNWLDEIKRSARFDMRDTGQVDFLADRIQPWLRLRIPPRRIPAQVTTPELAYRRIATGSMEIDNIASATVTSEATPSVTLPSEPNPGNLLVLQVAGTSHGGAKAPAGWDTAIETWDATPAGVAIYYKIANGNEGTTVTLDTGSSSAGNAVLTVHEITSTTGWPDNPLDVQTTGSESTSPATSGATPQTAEPRTAAFAALVCDRDIAATETSATGQPFDWSRNIENVTGDGTAGNAYMLAAAHFPTQRQQLEFAAEWSGSATARAVALAFVADHPFEPAHVREGSWVEWPLGVFLLSSPRRSTDRNGLRTRRVEAYDPLVVFRDDRVVDRYTIAEGEAYTQAISDLLGTIPKQIAHLGKTLPTDREWEPGTTKLTIVNDLLQAINYESLSFNEHGTAAVRPYVPLSERSPTWTYADDEVSLLESESVQEMDLFDVANQWVLVVSEPDQDPLSSVYTNDDPSSPTSTTRRQRTITDFRDNVQAADQEVLDGKVQRLATEASQVVESIKFQTPAMPHSGNDTYQLHMSGLSVNARYTEHYWQMSLSAGAWMRHRARRIIVV